MSFVVFLAKPFWRPIVLSREEAQRLMIRVKENDDEEAFRVLYERYQGAVLNYVAMWTRNQPLAEDLTHEVFLRVYRNRKSYEARAKFTAWLWTIARNVTFDHFKKKKELLSTSGEVSVDENLESHLNDAETALIENSEIEQVRSCFAELTDHQREALSLRIYSELSYEEISRVMNIKQTAVKPLLSRAKSALLKKLGQSRRSK